MNPEFALQLTDIRLLQTLRLLESSMVDHPDQETVRDALDALSSTRNSITKLIAGAAMRSECCA